MLEFYIILLTIHKVNDIVHIGVFRKKLMYNDSDICCDVEAHKTLNYHYTHSNIHIASRERADVLNCRVNRQGRKNGFISFIFLVIYLHM